MSVFVLVACTAGGRPPPEYHVAVTHTPGRAPASGRGTLALGTVEDRRDLADRARIGEVHAPVAPTPIVGGPAAQRGDVAVQLFALTATRSTSWYITVKDGAPVTASVRSLLADAVAQSGYAVDEGAPRRLDATIRTFWIRPSWTTRCQIAIELKVTDAAGVTLWRKPVSAEIDKFIGWFSEHAFEEAIRTTLDQLLQSIEQELESDEFPVAGRGR